MFKTTFGNRMIILIISNKSKSKLTFHNTKYDTETPIAKTSKTPSVTSRATTDLLFFCEYISVCRKDTKYNKFKIYIFYYQLHSNSKLGFVTFINSAINILLFFYTNKYVLGAAVLHFPPYSLICG